MFHFSGLFLLLLLLAALPAAESSYGEDLEPQGTTHSANPISLGNCPDLSSAVRIEIPNEPSLRAAMKEMGTLGNGTPQELRSAKPSGSNPDSTRRRQFQFDPRFATEYKNWSGTQALPSEAGPVPRTTQTFSPAPSWQKPSLGVLEGFSAKYKNGIKIYSSERGNIYIDPRDKKFKYRLKF